jgi:YHS domain-containing protein
MSTTTRPPDERIREASADADDPTAIDPVCGMDVDPTEASAEKTQHDGTTYYFCSPECRREFENSPREYTL